MSPSKRAISRKQCAFAGLALTALILFPTATSATAAEPLAQPHTVETQASIAAASSIALSSESAHPAEEITVTYQTDAPHSENWIGIYKDTVAPGDSPSLIWDYTPDATGSKTFTLDLEPGTYHVWFLAKGGYEALAEKLVLTVTPDPNAPLPLTPGDPNAPVVSTPTVTEVTTDGVIMREMFNAPELPAGWRMEHSAEGAGDPAYAGWALTDRSQWSKSVDEMRDRFGRTAKSFVVADAQQFGASPFTTTLTSAPVDVAALDSVRLTFDSHYRGATGQSGIVYASFDGGEPVEVLRLDETSVTNDYDGMQMNAGQDIVIDTPARAKTVEFSWVFSGDEDARYWGIDSVTVHQVQSETSKIPTQAWVVSDIQGHPADFERGLHGFAELSPDADGLLMVGDIVNSGSVGEWNEIYDVMGATTDIRPRQTIASMGNHERYAHGGFAANFQRFLDFAERDKAWGEYVLEGPAGDLPVIVLGQEMAGPGDVPMTDEQVEFLEARLAHWTELDKQVVVLSHFPLGNTVSASWLPWYSNHHMHNNRLTTIMGNYPNAVLLSGHTHYPAELGDWSMQRRTEGGHPDGFWAVNTLAMHIEWDARGENTSSVTEITTGDINRGLTLDSYGDRIVITAHDFATDAQLRQVTIPNPLVDFSADLAPDTERDADYSGVEAALSALPSDLSIFTSDSVSKLHAAVNAVVADLTADRQAEVDAMATAITDAISALVKKPIEGGGSDTSGDSTGSTPDGSSSGGSNVNTPGAGSTDDSLANTGSAGLGWGIAGVLALLGMGGALMLPRLKERETPDA